MTRYLERTVIARALKAETWKRRSGESPRDDGLSGHQYPAFSGPRAPIEEPGLTTGFQNTP